MYIRCDIAYTQYLIYLVSKFRALPAPQSVLALRGRLLDGGRELAQLLELLLTGAHGSVSGPELLRTSIRSLSWLVCGI